MILHKDLSLYRLFLQIKQRSPLITHKPDRLNLHIKQRSPLSIHKPDRLFPSTPNSDSILTNMLI
ncbi:MULTISPECIES: hypothetical protein [Pseudanabaena]|uniref:hypothetical protein n=1 Tax=Pseudanabaena TaxID=1152 RepID=UPI00247AC463|nr:MULTISPECIES: hypothetical protein [Pseudanabaena]MEA5488547.1 hypothetical protein [Pseudanabaena sp. CCNP1317]WGS71947.1 hypothetical protein OA858_19925 [Pseudanabaena galeata CCNP1313]